MNSTILRSKNVEDRPLDAVNVFDFIDILVSQKKSILIVMAVLCTLTVIITLLIPNTYRSQGILLPLSGKARSLADASSASGLSSILSSLAGTGNTTTNTFLAILESRSFAENIIKKENLMPVLFNSKWDHVNQTWKSNNPQKIPLLEDAVSKLKSKHVKIETNKKLQTIEINTFFTDRDVASRVGKSYIDELQKIIASESLTLSKRNRSFVGRQLDDARINLLNIGKDLDNFYQKYKVSNSSGKINPEIDLSDGTKHTLTNLPQNLWYENLQLRKEVMVNLNSLLSTQYEMAKIEESREALAFQVIDYPVSVQKKYGPKRALICVAVFIVGLFVTVFCSIALNLLNRAQTLR